MRVILFDLLIEMGIACSCAKSTRYRDAIHSRAQSCLASVKSKTGKSGKEKENQEYRRIPSDSKKGVHVKETVKNSVDPSEEVEDETAAPHIKEIKVLPPIRNRTNTVADISYKPNRVWGGSVSSYLDTIKRDSCIDEDLITGGKRKERRVSSLTHHKLRRESKSGQLISWEKHVTVLSEADETEEPAIEQAAFEKRRRSYRRNSELVSVIKV